MIQGSHVSIEGPQALRLYASRLLQERAVEYTAGSSEIDGALLYLDIVNSTGLTEHYATLGPDGAERLGEVLGAYLHVIFASIAERGGDIVGMEGDSVLALWRDEPDQPSAAERASDAALALSERLVGAPIAQRILVATGRLGATTLEPRERPPYSAACGGADFARLGRSRRASRGESCCRRVLRRVAGVTPGVRPWSVATPRSLPFFRPSLWSVSETVIAPGLPSFEPSTSIMIRLEGMESDSEDGTLLASAVRTVDAALADVGLAIAEVVQGDKGTVLRVAAGLPPYVLDDNAVGGLEAARRAVEALRRARYRRRCRRCDGPRFHGRGWRRASQTLRNPRTGDEPCGAVDANGEGRDPGLRRDRGRGQGPIRLFRAGFGRPQGPARARAGVPPARPSRAAARRPCRGRAFWPRRRRRSVRRFSRPIARTIQAGLPSSRASRERASLAFSPMSRRWRGSAAAS